MRDNRGCIGCLAVIVWLAALVLAWLGVRG